jgi:hypothetical protein
LPASQTNNQINFLESKKTQNKNVIQENILLIYHDRIQTPSSTVIALYRTIRTCWHVPFKRMYTTIYKLFFRTKQEEKNHIFESVIKIDDKKFVLKVYCVFLRFISFGSLSFIVNLLQFRLVRKKKTFFNSSLQDRSHQIPLDLGMLPSVGHMLSKTFQTVLSIWRKWKAPKFYQRNRIYRKMMIRNDTTDAKNPNKKPLFFRPFFLGAHPLCTDL